MQRREFLGVLGGAAALSFPQRGYAQTKTSVPLVGVLSPGRAEMSEDRIAALRLGVREAGFIEGTNYSLVIRFANGYLDRLSSLAKELGELNPRVLVTAGSALAARKILPEIPMVWTGVA